MGSFTVNSVPSLTSNRSSSRSTGFSLCPFLCILLAILISAPLSLSQNPANKSAPNSEARQSAPSANSKPVETEKNPAQIELLETKYRFETNGDSRKEVHTRVRINNELGVRQFARLNFDFNRSFQTVEIPLVHITHPSGGSADILPGAITDNPNPAVIEAPAYQDVRVKSVRILGLEPNDLLEYRVITTTTHYPLAPDFWLDHSFDRTGVVSQEIFELDLPASRNPIVRINPATPAQSTEKSGDGEDTRVIYSWDRPGTDTTRDSHDAGNEVHEPDVLLSTEQWEVLSIRLSEKLTPDAKPLESISTYEEQQSEVARRSRVSPEIIAKASELTKDANTSGGKLAALYDFVSQKIMTVDLPLGATGFAARPAKEVLASGYATPEDKFSLFSALTAAMKLSAGAALTGFCDSTAPAQPVLFKHLIISAYDGTKSLWLDPSLEVAPFGVVPANSGKCAFVLNWIFFEMNSTGHEWQALKINQPFPSVQKVLVNAQLDAEGVLSAKVRYTLRGDNELLLRVAFHKTPKEKWKEVAQLLAISDGFRGEIANVTVSDPYATKEPFAVEYEITQPKFIDWSKKPFRIPALLPLPGLPDTGSSARASMSNKLIDLGTPLEIELNSTIQLPEGTSSQAPIGTLVERDYATFSSKYSAQGNTLRATRKLRFISSQLPATRAADLNAFLHAIQADQTQSFTLQRTQATEK
jgi:hypothetical protein